MPITDGFKSMKADAHNDDIPEFTPPGPWSLSEIRAAIPPRLFVRDTGRGMVYLARDVVMAAGALAFATQINSTLADPFVVEHLGHTTAKVLQASAWIVYWWFQGLIFAGLWILGHECGHGAFSAHRSLCDALGFVLHSLLLTPYFSWKYSHHLHHSYIGLIEREEAFVPVTRSNLGIPEDRKGSTVNFEEYFSDTPIWTLCMLLQHQLLGLMAYFFFNVSGRKDYPRGTSHFNPYSPMYAKDQRRDILLSDIGVLIAAVCIKLACSTWGAQRVFMYYGVPWLCLSHWIVAVTFLQHTDPEVPYYRAGGWAFTRGAVSTVDRDFLGWMGQFFLHNVAHFHVVHHFFPKMPFYHGEEATVYIRKVLGEHYRSSTKPVFSALWDNFNNCQFVDDTGDVVFYRNRKGKTAYRLSEQ
ncbi:hypothetical protein NM688_g226 [Phlebia brevispora]|uniref:Uncharacterized protein n=1 Tax=Phlebia brevispora TaxID=194682 RepID=A0ACC1TF28_9APHY|nr:hypothetical protein NM688_g226 [Phlebia brevispora]